MSTPRALALSLTVGFALAGCGGRDAAMIPAAAPSAEPSPDPALGADTAEAEDASEKPQGSDTPPEAEQPASEPGQVHAVGATAKAIDYSLAVKSLQECQVKYYFKPKKGNIKLGVEVEVHGISDQNTPVNPYYAKIVDSDGYSYTATFGGCEPELKAVRVTQGETASGWISFEVPEKARGLVFSYDPIVIGSMKQGLKFDLGR